MKKLLGMLGLLFGVIVLSHAGTPQETFYMGQPPLSNTTIYGSTFTSTSPITTIPSPTCYIGGSTTSPGRVCLTKEIVQISTAAVFYALDAGTTVQYVQGFALSGSSTATGANTISIPEDHLGPLCFTAGNTVTLSVVGSGVPGLNNAINYEGYTTCGGTSNKGSGY